jgi:hypothetical protein
LKNLAFAFLTACVYWFLTSLKSCISRGLFDANAVHHRMFLCWSRAVRSGVNHGLYLFLVLHVFEWGLFKMVRKALLYVSSILYSHNIKLKYWQDVNML